MPSRSFLGVACALAVLAVPLAGCGSDDDGGSTAGSSTSSASSGGDKGYTVAFIPGCTCDPYYSTETAGFEEEAAKLGVEAIVQGGANFDPGDQVPVLQAVIQKKPDLIVIDPTDQQALVGPIKLATEQGIPVITTGNEISADLAITKIAASSIEGGREAGKFVLEQAGDASGPVLVNNTEPGVSSVADRDTGFREALDGSSLELLDTQYNNDDQAKAASITSSTLRAHSDLVAVFATNVLSAQGVANALRGAGQAGKDVIAVGYDASEEQIRALREGLLDAVISQDPRQIGALAVQNAVKYLDGDQSIPKDQPLKPIVITRDNVDDPEIQKTIYR
jgi:ribose transport system substrate-binding protein